MNEYEKLEKIGEGISLKLNEREMKQSEMTKQSFEVDVFFLKVHTVSYTKRRIKLLANWSPLR